MALEGTLESFAISEIFQLIATQAKTGVLEIDTPEGKARIRFVNGNLLDAYPAEVDPNRAIGAILVNAGLITPRQLEYALEVQKRNLRRLGDVIIRMGAIRTSEFQEMLALQRREMAYNLLRLRRGKYVFRNEDVQYEEGVDTLMNVDSILMEGSRQIDEWPAIMKLIPSDGRIFKRVPGTAPMRELTDEESVVLDLLDGERTVRDIINRSRLGEFPAWDALANIYNDGLVVPVEQKKAKTFTQPKPAAKKKPVALDATVSAILLALAVVVLVAPRLVGTSGRVGLPTVIRAAKADLEDVQRRSAEWESRGPVFWPDLSSREK